MACISAIAFSGSATNEDDPILKSTFPPTAAQPGTESTEVVHTESREDGVPVDESEPAPAEVVHSVNEFPQPVHPQPEWRELDK